MEAQMNQNLHAPAKYPPFENREGWGSLTRVTQRVGQPAVHLFVIFASVVFLVVVSSSSSQSGTGATIQTRDTVQRLYGSPVSEIYQTPKGLNITASFASSGNLCRAHIRSDDASGITDEQLNQVLERLAPESVRGKHKMGTFLHGTCLKLTKAENSMSDSGGKPSMDVTVDPCAECSGVSEDYDQANITRYGSTNEYSSVWVTFHRPECKELNGARH
jgi:hypothetical protein